MSRSRYVYVCQNESTEHYYNSEFLDGLLAGHVFILPPIITPIDPDRRADSLLVARSRLEIDHHIFTLLSFGAIHEGKDFATILEAIGSSKDILLIQAGRINHVRRSEMETLKKKYSSENIVIHDAFIPEDMKPSYFNSADAVVLSYKSDFEGTASMLWETCRFGVPVIASDNRQLSELISKYKVGLTFHSGDPESLRQALKLFRSLSGEQLSAMRNETRRFCMDFSIPKWEQELTTVFQHLENEV